MKIKLNNEFWLILVATVLLIAAFIPLDFMPLNIVRIIVGIPLVLFFPGYMLISALFPKGEALGGTERVALSFGLSIAVVGLSLYILNHTPWGITLYSILISVAIFITITSILTWYRRHRLPEEHRASLTFHITLLKVGRMHGWNIFLSVFLVLLLLAGIGTTVYVANIPRVGEQYTEFYLLGLEYEAKDYPKKVAVGESGRVIVVIINHEKAEVRYQLHVRINGETNEERGPIVLDDEQRWEDRISFILEKVGDNQEVEFLLYKEGMVEPYHLLRLWVDVAE